MYCTPQRNFNPSQQYTCRRFPLPSMMFVLLLWYLHRIASDGSHISILQYCDWFQQQQKLLRSNVHAQQQREKKVTHYRAQFMAWLFFVCLDLFVCCLFAMPIPIEILNFEFDGMPVFIRNSEYTAGLSRWKHDRSLWFSHMRCCFCFPCMHSVL